MNTPLLIWLFAASFGLSVACYGFVWSIFLIFNRRLDRRHEEINSRMEMRSKDLYEYKIFVASQFATSIGVNALENKMNGRLDKISDKLDSLLERRNDGSR